MKPFTFTISRKADPSLDGSDPFAGFDFSPARDSDELYDILRSVYPKITNHRDRLFRAVTDQLSVRPSHDDTQGRHGYASPPSTTSSLRSSAEYVPPVSLPTSKQEKSPDPVDDELETPCHRMAMRSMMQAFAFEQDGLTVARSKRPMTEQERSHYRRMKQIGACVECRKKKRRCQHMLKEAGDQLSKRQRVADNANLLAVKHSSQTVFNPDSSSGLTANDFDFRQDTAAFMTYSTTGYSPPIADLTTSASTTSLDLADSTPTLVSASNTDSSPFDRILTDAGQASSQKLSVSSVDSNFTYPTPAASQSPPTSNASFAAREDGWGSLNSSFDASVSASSSATISRSASDDDFNPLETTVNHDSSFLSPKPMGPAISVDFNLQALSTGLSGPVRGPSPSPTPVDWAAWSQFLNLPPSPAPLIGYGTPDQQPELDTKLLSTFDDLVASPTEMEVVPRTWSTDKPVHIEWSNSGKSAYNFLDILKLLSSGPARRGSADSGHLPGQCAQSTIKQNDDMDCLLEGFCSAVISWEDVREQNLSDIVECVDSAASRYLLYDRQTSRAWQFDDKVVNSLPFLLNVVQRLLSKRRNSNAP